MPSFIFTPLLWGLFAVSIPIIIHLINMLRHRRVAWAAMEFLLVSQKKHRTWIIFKQLLLLLMRMAAVAAVVTLLAGPQMQNWVGRVLGTSKTHHIVILDDSFSMSDLDPTTNASVFGEAKEVVEKIAAAAAAEDQPQEFTLITYTGAAKSAPPVLSRQTVNRTEFPKQIKDELKSIYVSQRAVGPGGAVKAVAEMSGESEAERRIIYVVSDFREREWSDPKEVRRQLADVGEGETEIHVINCAEEPRANLAIASVATGSGVRAVGVEWPLEVSVKNFGPDTAHDVKVSLDRKKHNEATVTIPKILPGRTEKAEFKRTFHEPGRLELSLSLPDDAIKFDNTRHYLCDLPLTLPVLLIDGSPRTVDGAAGSLDASLLSFVLMPGANLKTGLVPQIERPSYLNRAKSLQKYHSIVLTNVARLDDQAIAALEEYAGGGGGVAFFLGEQCDGRVITETLYRGGKGLFPVPLVADPQELRRERLEPAPDLSVDKEYEDHQILRAMTSTLRGFLHRINFYWYFAVPDGWTPLEESTTRVIARLRNGAPLIAERDFGEGRVVAFLTSAFPKRPSTDIDNDEPVFWNNWAFEETGTFVVVMLEMQKYLSRRSVAEVSDEVGSKLSLTLDAEQYTGKVEFFTPDDDAMPLPSDAGAEKSDDGNWSVTFSDTDVAGVYRAELSGQDGGTPEVRHFAVNVDPEEGDLSTRSGEDLADALPGIDYKYARAERFKLEVGETPGEDVAMWWLLGLVALLIFEQILAYLISYHPARRSSPPVLAMAKGGAR